MGIGNGGPVGGGGSVETVDTDPDTEMGTRGSRWVSRVTPAVSNDDDTAKA